MDLRIQKTYKALIAAFTTLLEQYPYEEISIAMLCDEAMIRRTTFYKHFADKAAFFAFFVDSLRIDMERRGEQASEVQDVSTGAYDERVAIFKQLVDFLLEHERMMDNIFKSSMVGSMTLVMCNKVSEVICERYRDAFTAREGNELRIEEAAQFAAAGIMRLLELWWERGHSADEEEAFIRMSNLLVARVIGF